MFIRHLPRLVAVALIAFLAPTTAPSAHAQRKVTTPKEQFGFNIGDDYHLANYRQLTAYWQKLDRESDRVKVVPIGLTEEGRTQFMAVISSPANLRRADQYRDITRRLALAEGLTDAGARKLAQDGRAIVWISGGLHASETLVAQQLIETVYQFASRDDAETRRILDNVILLAVLANPDGMDLVADWYMREPDPKKRVPANYPRLYQKYIGHDNNRDFYAVTQAETKNMNRVMFHEWFPQIVYDHHQSGPPGTVMFAPPFRDPFNYRMDPRIVSGIDAVGAAMMNRFLAEGKPGVTVRSGARYSTWWNGGLRSVTYYHNMIGLLTETIGSPTPITIPFDPRLQLPRGDLPAPIEPQPWPFRNSVEYSLTASRAVLDYAARHREELLWNAYALGRDAIAAGSRDSWTASPTQMARAQAELKKRADAEKKAKASAKSKTAKKSTTTKSAPKVDPRKDFAKFFRDPKERDPRGYIVPANQPDFGTATRFINTLIENGIRVLRATNSFALASGTYPAGSYVVPCNQAFRAHVLDAFEPQDHPNDLQYPGGPPVAPYDVAGWTLAMQMAVQFDRVWENVSGPFAVVREVQKSPPGTVINTQAAAGYYLRADANDAYRAINRLLVIGDPVQRLTVSVTNAAGAFAPGTFYLPTSAHSLAQLELIAKDTGVTFIGGSAPVADQLATLRKPRVGLWDRYGGSMPSGWTRWLLERFEFPFEVVFPPRLDAGKLREQFDVLIFVTGAIPAQSTNATASASGGDSGESTTASGTGSSSSLSETNLPPEYRGRRGNVTATNTIPKLREFIAAGGVVLTIGSSTELAEHLGLPLENHLVEKPERTKGDEGKDKDKEEGNAKPKSSKPKPLPREKFYIPGSLMRARVDATHPLAWGLGEQADFMFQGSPVFRTAAPKPVAAANGETTSEPAPPVAPIATVTRVAWFDEPAPLRSGWALGQEYLQDGWAVAEAKVGAGSVALFGPEIAFRAQPHGTFKLLFNGILNAGMQSP